MNPTVSVIIPTYNREKYIGKALESILSQSYQNFEILIVDDGSTDGTKKILEPFLKDPRIRYLYQKNQKVSKARINGINHSTGKYIALLDSDDAWIGNQKLEKQVGFLEAHPDYALVSGGIIRALSNGKELSRILNPETDEQIRKGMLFSCLFAPSAAVFRRDAYEKVGGFNANSDLSEDWELFIQLGTVGKCYNFQEYFLAYLQGPQNRSNFNRRKNLTYNLGLIKRYQNAYPNFKKALAVHFCYLVYSYIPFHQQLFPLFSYVKRMVFGKPFYKESL